MGSPEERARVMAQAEAHAMSAIGHFIESMHGICTEFARQCGPFFPRLLDAYEAEIQRWRARITPGATGDPGNP